MNRYPQLDLPALDLPVVGAQCSEAAFEPFISDAFGMLPVALRGPSLVWTLCPADLGAFELNTVCSAGDNEWSMPNRSGPAGDHMMRGMDHGRDRGAVIFGGMAIK